MKRWWPSVLWLQYSDRDPQSVFHGPAFEGEPSAKDLRRHRPHRTEPRRAEPRLRRRARSRMAATHSWPSSERTLLASRGRGRGEDFRLRRMLHIPSRPTQSSVLAIIGCRRGDVGRALSAQIRADGIDILVDLTGHAGVSGCVRPTSEAEQVNWLGYLNTTGLRAMDYRLVDDITDPPVESDAAKTWELWLLPAGWACFRPYGRHARSGAAPGLA